MVAIAKRENNNKRSYLVVNRLQGKHIPVSGKKAFEVFDSLAEKVRQDTKDGEQILVVGFAETATAIGARLAVTLNCRYMQTTRENVSNADYLFFTESHSHATEQKLVKNDIDCVIDDLDRIIFAEDEVTTGNTIMKIINIIEKMYPNRVKFSVASLLNGMDKESLKKYDAKNISVYYLLKTDHSSFSAIADSFKGDGKYFEKNISEANVNIYDISDNYINTRRLTDAAIYEKSCQKLFEKIKSQTNLSEIRTMAVIGTEEFMYPALYIAAAFEECGINAVSHSATRSPIAVSSEEDYPLHCRFELASLYDPDRKTFIYDLKKYDCVLIITDSANNSKNGINSLVNAIKLAGSSSINIYRWCSNDSNS